MRRKNIVLTGFMGTGKSSVGRLLAKRLGYTFVDTDVMIVEKAGRSINDIFEREGEFAFRQWEQEVSRQLSGKDGLVIATGGRLMLDSENAALLSLSAYVFCLTARPEEIARRLVGQPGTRPLLEAPDLEKRIHELLAQREAAYRKFPQIETDGKSINVVIEEIMRCISVT